MTEGLIPVRDRRPLPVSTHVTADRQKCEAWWMGLGKEILMTIRIIRQAKWPCGRISLRYIGLSPHARDFQRCLIRSETERPPSYADTSNYC